MKRDLVPWLIIAAMLVMPALAAPLIQVAGTGPWNQNIPVVGFPMGAVDASGKLQQLEVNASGELLVACSGCGGGGGGGTVTVDNAAGAAAVNIQDGGNSITVDGTIAATQSGTWNIGSITTLPALPAGTNNIGDVDVLSLPSLPAGANAIGSVSVSNFPATQDVNCVTGCAGGTFNNNADNVATSATNGQSASWLYVWDGAAWDRAPGSSTDGQLVNLGANNDVTVTGTVAATQSGTWLLGANSGVDIGDVTINNAAGAAAVNVQDGGNSLTVDGTVGATQSGTWTFQNVGGTTGGLTKFNLAAAASTNATSVKASAGTVYHVAGFGISATPAWVTFYNTAGVPTCGTGVVWQTVIPGVATGAGGIEDIAQGLDFSTGIGICVTTGIGGTGAVAASTFVLNIGYK